MLPHALSIGVPYDTFWHLSPKKLKAFYKAHEERIREQDYLAWLFNQYTLSAVSVAVEHCLAGKKARSEYIKKPFLQDIKKTENSNKESQEEVAVFEMKQRINLLREQGLPESPI